MKSPLTHKWNGQSLDLIGTQGGVLRSFKFSELGLAVEIYEPLARAFVAVAGHTELSSHVEHWMAIRNFAKFLHFEQRNAHVNLNSDVLVDYADWLAACQIKGSTKQTRFNFISSLLSWCLRNSSSILSEGLNEKLRRFSRDVPKAKRTLDDGLLKRILTACYVEIEEFEKRLTDGERIKKGHTKNAVESLQYRIIHDLLELENGSLPGEEKWVGKYAYIHRKISKVGGHEYLWSMLWVTPRMLFPYYLATLLQTSGNQSAISQIEVDCIRQHPIRTDLERLVWIKPRSHSEQVVDFPKSFERSAPNLVRRIVDLTRPIRMKADVHGQKCVFIGYSARSQNVCVPCYQTWHIYLEDFIKVHELPDFDFKDLRSSGAKAHKKAAGDIDAARLHLNHKKAETTRRNYVSLEEDAADHARVIRIFQGQLIAMSRRAVITERKVLVSKKPLSESTAFTLFGFKCRDPFAGISPLGTKGKRCLHFTGCATCPGAIVLLDDIENVARLVAAKAALSEAKERAFGQGWMQRFDALYMPMLSILESDIFPYIQEKILKAAEARATSYSVPRLE